MYGAEFSKIYDLIYSGRGKDYLAESTEVADVVRARHASASSLLDVACGTGAHLAYFKDWFEVAGLDASEHMVRQAGENLPGVSVREGDMRDFDLGRAFDAIVCMFSSIGYLRSPEELDRTLACMARHLNPGGVIVIEPWHTPGTFIPGYIAHDLVKGNDQVVVRLSHSQRTGDRVPINVHYLVGDRATGVRHFTDVHEMNLFTRRQYETAFERAGCRVEYIESGRFACGLFAGVLK